jgi:hypothetical protein
MATGRKPLGGMTLMAKCALQLNGTFGKSIETPGFRNVT